MGHSLCEQWRRRRWPQQHQNRVNKIQFSDQNHKLIRHSASVWSRMALVRCMRVYVFIVSGSGVFRTINALDFTYTIH